MPGWVQADPDVVLRLVLWERRAHGDRMRDPGHQVVDPDLQVHHHLLVTRPGRPDGADVTRLGLEVKAGPAARRPEYHPAGFLRNRDPAEESAVEVRERVSIRPVDVRTGKRQPWWSHGSGVPPPAQTAASQPVRPNRYTQLTYGL
jgi:hypothetical protein